MTAYKEEFKINKALEILGFKEDLALETKSFLLDSIMDYLFKPNKGSGNGVRLFDLDLDYRYYFVDFLDKGINLNKEDIPWLEFDSILESIFLNEKSTIGKVIGFRAYKKPANNIKTHEAEMHKYHTKKQQEYALPLKPEELDKNMEKMWNYLEKKAGGNDE